MTATTYELPPKTLIQLRKYEGRSIQWVCSKFGIGLVTAEKLFKDGGEFHPNTIHRIQATLKKLIDGGDQGELFKEDAAGQELVRQALWIITAMGSPSLDQDDIDNWKDNAKRYLK